MGWLKRLIGLEAPLERRGTIVKPIRHCDECGAEVIDGTRADGFDRLTGAARYETFRACQAIVHVLVAMERGHYPSFDGSTPGVGRHYHYFPRFWQPYFPDDAWNPTKPGLG